MTPVLCLVYIFVVTLHCYLHDDRATFYIQTRWVKIQSLVRIAHPLPAFRPNGRTSEM